MVSRVIPVDPFELVIFGATGDLARKKILPALWRRFRAGQMPEAARVIGAARTDLDADGWRRMAAEAIGQAEGLDDFLSRLDYVTLDATGDDGWPALRQACGTPAIRAFYFSVAPSLFAPLAERVRAHGLADDETRVVVEKPFGHDLASARALNAALAAQFAEEQIYRIDHYLGKETVQNLMAVRFGNMLFEPLWNAQYVDHIQITVAETLGVAGRADYYDRAGAMRDMVQNHLMQLLCLIAMEPPARFESGAVRDEKLKVIRALEPPRWLVRGQYGAGAGMEAYGTDVGDAASATETFVALRAEVGNWRWVGTPFYLRTGKRLSARSSEIAVVFKDTPHSIFGIDAGAHRNVLAIQLQPNEGMKLWVTIKEPGPGGMRLLDVPLDMTFAETLGPEAEEIPDAYERLIMDVIRGNQTLFMRGDEVEAAWAWADAAIAEWERGGERPELYPAGSEGPRGAERMMAQDQRLWRDIAG